MAKRILDRKGLRADYDAAEARNKEEEETEEEDDDDEDDDDEEEEGEASEEEGEEGGGEESEEGGDEDEEEAPKKKKKPKKAPAKPRSRARVAKVVRMRQVWGVFNNSNVCVSTFEYPRRQDAIDHAAKLTTDKRSTHFVQPVKEPIEEKKEK